MRVREGQRGSSEPREGIGGKQDKMSTLDYLVTKMRRHVRSPSSDVSTPVRTPDVEDEVELRVSEDEGAVEAEDATLPQPHHRPPIYNTEDYTTALAKYARAHNLYMPDPPKDKKGRSRDKEKGGSREATPEMSLKQFSSLPELLKRLRDDLKMSYLSFVKELVGDPNDCVTLLLDVLKMVQLAQTDLNGSASSREQQAALRRALIDEHECLACLRFCLRCSDAALKLAHYHPGLYTLAVATMSNLARSRTLALQLLTRSCQTNAAGHRQVIDALATLRLRFSEPVRCKFLVSMMNSHPHNNFQVWALRFINALVSSAGGLRSKIYLQEELAEAGFDPSILKKSIERSGSDSLVQTALQELKRWNDQFIDVESLEDEVLSARESNIHLQEELQKLRKANMKLLEENILLKTVGREVEERSAALQRRLEANGLPAAPSPTPSITDSDLSSLNTIRNTPYHSSVSPARNKRYISPSLAESVSSSQDDRSISPVWNVEPVHRSKSSEILQGSSSKSSSGESSQASTRPSSVSVTPTKSFNSRQSSSASSTPEPKTSSKSSSGYVSPLRSRTASPITNGDFIVESTHANKRSPSIRDNEHRRHEDRYNEHMPKNDINMTFLKESKPSAVQGNLSPRSTSPQLEGHDQMKKSRSNSRLRQQVPEEPPPLNIDTHANGKEIKHKNPSPAHSNESSSERSSQNSSSQTSSATQTPEPNTPSTLKRKAPRPPSSKSASSLSSSNSSLSSSSSATSSGGGGERKESKDPEYMNVPRRDLSLDKINRSSDDNDLDYERDVVVYEAITVANDRFFMKKTSTQDSRSSGNSQSSTESKNSSNKSSSSSNRTNNSRSASSKSSSSKAHKNRKNSNISNDRGDSNNNEDDDEDGPNVKDSVRHYENLVVTTDQNGKDIRIEGFNDERGNENRKITKQLVNERSNLRRDVSEREVEAVMNGFENVIRSAESSLSVASQETVKENPLLDQRFEDCASPDHQIREEIEIVPTRLPQLPARPRSRNSQGGNLPDPILYLEFESPAETSDTESLLRSSQPPPSPRTMETESTKSFGFVRPERSLRRRETFTDRSISGQESRGSRGVRRSESFQTGNKSDYNSHRSYSPRRRGSVDLLVQSDEREVQINGKVYTKYTPHEVERRNRRNELITRELNKQKLNRSMEDRLDQWFESQGDPEWTLKWKYPEIEENSEYVNENENRRKSDNKSPTRKENNRKSKSKRPDSKSPSRLLEDLSHSPIYNEVPGPPAKPSRTGKPKKFTNAEISAFNGFKNPNGFRESDYGPGPKGFRESDYGPNFMLNKPNSRLAGEYSEYADYGGRDYPLPNSRNGREKSSRRRSELIDPAIPSPDYSATPVNTMSTIANGNSPSKHILDMPSGLY